MAFAPYPPTVPNVVGMYYPDAQAALLGAGFLIAFPTFVLPNAAAGMNATAGSNIISAGDAGPLLSAGSAGLPGVDQQVPGYVIAQSVLPGTQTLAQVLVAITVLGFTIIAQPNTPVPVP